MSRSFSSTRERDREVEVALARIERQFGHSAIVWLGRSQYEPIRVIPSSAIALNIALRVGGLPYGRTVELYGREGSGKTTVALDFIANAQRLGGLCAFIDSEHALDPEYAKAIGVNTDDLLLSQPDTGEQALEIVDMLVTSGALDLIVVDSVAALVPKAEIEGEMGDSHVGLHPRLMSQAMRKLAGHIAQNHVAIIYINQIRENVGVLFGSPEKTTGGHALKFYSTVRIDLRHIETIKDGTDPVGIRTRAKMVKNKVGRPYGIAEFDIIFGQGISRAGGLIDLGVELGIIRKSGAWYTYDGDQLGQGKELARAFLTDSPDLSTAIEKLILEKLDLHPLIGLPNGYTQSPPAPRRAAVRSRPSS